MRVSGFRIHRKNPFELYFLSLVVAGVVVGTFLFQSVFSVSQFYVEALRPSDAGIKTLIKLFFKGFAGNSVFMLVLFVCGFSAVLQPLILLTGFIRGVGIGLVVSSIYSSIGAQGIFNAFVYLAIPSFFRQGRLRLCRFLSQEQYSVSVILLALESPQGCMF